MGSAWAADSTYFEWYDVNATRVIGFPWTGLNAAVGRTCFGLDPARRLPDLGSSRRRHSWMSSPSTTATSDTSPSASCPFFCSSLPLTPAHTPARARQNLPPALGEQRAPRHFSSVTGRHRRRPRNNCNTTLHTALLTSRTYGISSSPAVATSPPYLPSDCEIDRRLPHNTPPTPPKCLPQSFNVAASPSPRG